MSTTTHTGVPTSVRATDRLKMAHDASHYLLVPESVATPRTAADVAALFRASHESGVPLTFRSGGTSLSGQGVTAGILADTRAEFRRVQVLDGGARVRVQPGATVRTVNAHLARHGRKLGPDPASEIACTIGGVVANNSSGMACGTEFNTYRTLDSLVVVLPSGTVVDSAADDADERLRHDEPELWQGLSQLRDRVRGNQESVRIVRQQFSMKNTMGYGINALLDHDRPVDILTHLLVGSEGTLAFIAEATFRTVPALPAAATGLAIFPTLQAATGALPDLVGAGLATIELMDATSLRVAQGLRESTPALSALHVEDQAAFLIEYLAQTPEEVADQQAATAGILAALDVTAPVSLTADPRERAALWSIRKGLYTSVAGARPSGTTALLEDVVVPVPALLGTCQSLLELFDRHSYKESVIFGHAKDGNIHFMLNESFEDPANLERYQRFTEDMVDVVLGNNGSLKAEHGTGRIMAPFVRRQYGDELHDVMCRIKALFDPHGILSPGVVLSDDPTSYVRDLKQAPEVEPEVDRCVECGYCEPSCPSQHLTLTPRQRIVLRREVASARAAGDHRLVAELEADYGYEGLDTCAVDGMCQVACPVEINTGDLVRRLRGERVGPVRDALWDSAARRWAPVTKGAGAALTVAGAVPGTAAGVTRLGRRALGHETAPLYDAGLPRGGVARRPVVAPDAEAVFFPACIGTMFGPGTDQPGVSTAFLRLCERVGVSVRVPEEIASMCCGTPWKSKGLGRGYDRMTGQVLPALWAATDEGRLPVVCDASSCTEGLGTMRRLADDPSGRWAGLRFVDAVEFAAERLLPGLTVTAPLGSLALHHTCSSTQLGTNASATVVAAAIAGEVTVPVSWGCCAFAGDRGLLHPELTASATAREAAEVTSREYDAYASVNRTCEIGMSRATGQRYAHLLELLEQATR
jgi:D-lactate dehydrogenase